MTTVLKRCNENTHKTFPTRRLLDYQPKYIYVRKNSQIRKPFQRRPSKTTSLTWFRNTTIHSRTTHTHTTVLSRSQQTATNPVVKLVATWRTKKFCSPCFVLGRKGMILLHYKSFTDFLNSCFFIHVFLQHQILKCFFSFPVETSLTAPKL